MITSDIGALPNNPHEIHNSSAVTVTAAAVKDRVRISEKAIVIMENPNDNDDGNVDYDDEPVFLSAEDGLVEAVPDEGGEPMDDDDEDMADGDDVDAGPEASSAAGGGSESGGGGGPDASSVTLRSHSGPVYCASSHLDPTTGHLTIVTGGGDDKAFLHKVALSSPSSPPAPSTPPSSESKPLCARSDTVSSVALNTPYVDPSASGAASRKLAAAGSYDGNIGLYDSDTGEEVTTLDGPTDVEFLCWHPKGGTVLLAGSTDGTAWMYHAPTSRCLQVFVGHESGDGGGGGVSAGTFTPDGRFALTAGMDGTLRLWAPKTGACKHVFKLSEQDGGGGGGLTCLSAGGGPDGQLAVAGCEDGTAGVVHLKGRKNVATLAHYDGPSPSAAGGGGGMDVDDGGEGDDAAMQDARSVEAVSFAPSSVNPHWVATGGVDGTVKVWDLTHGTGQMRHACRPAPQGDEGEVSVDVGGVTSLRWHPTLPVLLASYADGSVRIWDARDGAAVATLQGGHDGVMINGMDAQFVVPGEGGSGGGGKAVVVTAVDDGSVKVFEVDVDGTIARAAEERRARLAQAQAQQQAQQQAAP